MSVAARAHLLRQLAGFLDDEAERARRGCFCPVHRVLAREYDRLATGYRQRAIEELQASPRPAAAREADRG